jgi:hypothetical protein
LDKEKSGNPGFTETRGEPLSTQQVQVSSEGSVDRDQGDQNCFGKMTEVLNPPNIGPAQKFFSLRLNYVFLKTYYKSCPCFDKFMEIFPKWRNFAHCGHTVREPATANIRRGRCNWSKYQPAEFSDDFCQSFKRLKFWRVKFMPG